MVAILNDSPKPKTNEPIVKYKYVENESEMLNETFNYLFELLEKELEA